MSSALVSPRFPEGLRVLLVDDDLVCLENMKQMLEECRYQVTKFSRVDDALTQLRQKMNKFDIMITDVRISDTNDHQLMEVALQMDIPVILMSAADEDMKRIIKGVARGAHYLVKPVTMKTVRSIWQHAVRKMKHLWKDLEVEVQAFEDDDGQEKSPESSESNSKGSKRKMMQKENDDDDNNNGGVDGGEPHELDNHLTPPTKKARVVWSAELHQQFVAAVGKLGIDKAVPKKILESMNVPELTRENVASHLQKYRLYLRRQEAQVQGTSANQQTGYQVADRSSATQTSYRSSATHEFNAKQQQHVIPQQQPSYYGGSQQFSMIQSSFGNLIVTRRDVSGFNTGISAATSIRTAGGVGCSGIMNGLPTMINYQPSNEMALLSLNNHNLVANNCYSDPAYNTFSHITSVGLEFQNNTFDDYHHENSILPNYFHVGEETENLVGPVVDNPKSEESLLMVSQVYSEHPQWNQSYSAEEMQ